MRRLTLVRLHAVIERARAAGLDVTPGMPALVIKEVNGSHAANLVMSLFPRSRMIFMLRDGRDILDSLIDANRPGGWRTRTGLGEGGFDSPEDRLEWLRDASRTWAARMNVCADAYERHDQTLRIRLRYEDLLADTPRVLGNLAGWLGLPDDPARIQTIVERNAFSSVPDRKKGPGKRRRVASPGRWREVLSPREREVANEIMGRQLAEFGYEIDATAS